MPILQDGWASQLIRALAFGASIARQLGITVDTHKEGSKKKTSLAWQDTHLPVHVKFTTASSSIASCHIHDAGRTLLCDKFEFLLQHFSLQCVQRF